MMIVSLFQCSSTATQIPMNVPLMAMKIRVQIYCLKKWRLVPTPFPFHFSRTRKSYPKKAPKLKPNNSKKPSNSKFFIFIFTPFFKNSKIKKKKTHSSYFVLIFSLIRLNVIGVIWRIPLLINIESHNIINN